MVSPPSIWPAALDAPPPSSVDHPALWFDLALFCLVLAYPQRTLSLNCFPTPALTCYPTCPSVAKFQASLYLGPNLRMSEKKLKTNPTVKTQGPNLTNGHSHPVLQLLVSFCLQISILGMSVGWPLCWETDVVRGEIWREVSFQREALFLRPEWR